MQMTIEIPDNLPKEMVIRQIRELEGKLRKDAEFFTGKPVVHNKMKNYHSLTVNQDDKKHILKKLKSLVQKGSISESRNFLSSIPHIKSQELDNWRKTLTSPKVKQEKAATGESLKEDAAWLQNNSMSYQGKWVALKHGTLIGSHESQLELYRNLKQSGSFKGAMFFKLEKKDI